MNYYLFLSEFKSIQTHSDIFRLEKGVFAAVNHEYIKAMTFTIFTKHPLTDEEIILENYEFKLIDEDGDDHEGGNISQAMVQEEVEENDEEKKKKNKKNKAALATTLSDKKMLTKNQLKAQASKFVRSLVEFTNTLDELPPDRWITLSLSVGV